MADHVETRGARMASFAEFWPYYVAAHRKPLTRALHYFGTTSALGCLAFAALTGNWPWLFAVPLVGYGPAWIGHFFVEGNRPATFGYARFSLLADFKMLGLALRGKMGEEAKRVLSGAIEQR